MEIACLDLEGVLVPEIWIEFANKTGIEELKATTRDIPDYDVLMKQRLRILDEHGLKLKDIQEVIATLKPLDGAIEFVDWLRERFQVIILSDTFYEFSQPLMRQLGFPTLFCHRLVTDEEGRVVDYKLRQADPKRQSIRALQTIYYRTIAAGDSYNRSEEHTSELQSRPHLVCRLLLEKKNTSPVDPAAGRSCRGESRPDAGATSTERPRWSSIWSACASARGALPRPRWWTG